MAALTAGRPGARRASGAGPRAGVGPDLLELLAEPVDVLAHPLPRGLMVPALADHRLREDDGVREGIPQREGGPLLVRDRHPLHAVARAQVLAEQHRDDVQQHRQLLGVQLLGFGLRAGQHGVVVGGDRVQVQVVHALLRGEVAADAYPLPLGLGQGAHLGLVGHGLHPARRVRCRRRRNGRRRPRFRSRNGGVSQRFRSRNGEEPGDGPPEASDPPAGALVDATDVAPPATRRACGPSSSAAPART
ncbi:hypothetical protein MICRO11B_10048 [Micrococcus luteus]|nr:hypothetical protein MICRO11B_10048 [Micrococcus luteus]